MCVEDPSARKLIDRGWGLQNQNFEFNSFDRNSRNLAMDYGKRKNPEYRFAIGRNPKKQNHTPSLNGLKK